MKLFIKPLILTALLFSFAVKAQSQELTQLSKYIDLTLLARRGGAGSTGGGDKRLLVQNLGDRAPTQQSQKNKFLKDFIQKGNESLDELSKYAAMGWTFSHAEQVVVLTQDHIKKARNILKTLEKNPDNFQIDDNLMNSDTNEARLAHNTLDGTFTLNSREWLLLEQDYSLHIADQMRRVIVAHEIFQQPGLGFEATGNFIVSSQPIKIGYSQRKFEDLSQLSPSSRIFKGKVREASCNTVAHTGEAKVEYINKNGDLEMVMYNIGNPKLCTRADRVTDAWQNAPIIEMAYNNGFGMPTEALFAIDCRVKDKRTLCDIIDFQTISTGHDDLKPYVLLKSGANVYLTDQRLNDEFGNVLTKENPRTRIQ